ncbi:EAL domain-containing protein [Aerosakkonema funiforme]|uniref:histidine kinase n=1 Tax=Aerosakkonema funiforme FACHB-1375 TaxID=2949571 RepID=A0A926VEV0_9CYAN|nr:EAL domain-containing protein [Aerosakkonema funiforme]MBD2181677.1 EAL domain-containing protein [Aerosakkonema funiforme FACHB-1375]
MTKITVGDQNHTWENNLPDVFAASDADQCATLVSYELRTPLTSIRGALSLLLSGKLGTLTKQSQRLLEIAIKNTDRLMRLTRAIENDEELSLSILTATNLALYRLENDLRLAIEHKELELYYQPIVCLETNRITGFEALTRWRHPQRGFISPTEFIPIAEKTRLINPLGTWAIESACRQLKSWQQQFPNCQPLTMSVNVSSIQLSQLDLVEQVQRILHETGVASSSLRLEITESTIMENPTRAIATLKQLKSLGLKLYLDDFGTGYSSLSCLHELPIDVLKIDRSFVTQKKWDLIWTIMMLAYSQKLEAIAEGVETAEQLAQLKLLGCQKAQGYFFSQPVNVEAAEALLTEFTQAGNFTPGWKLNS